MIEKELNLKLDKRPINMRQFWLRLWRLITPTHKQIAYLLVLIMAFEGAKFIGPYLLKRIIDLITDFKVEYIKDIIILIILILISDLLVNLIDYFADKKIFRIIVGVERYLSINAQKKMVELGLSYHEKENTGNKIFKIHRGIDKITDLIGNFFWEVGPTIIQVVMTGVILFLVDWRFGLIFSLFTPVFIYLTAKLNKKISPLRRLRHDLYEEAAGKMTQTIININTVKSFVQEDREVDEFKKIKDKSKKVALFEFFKMLSYNYSRSTVITVGRVLIILFGVYLVWSGGITIGSLVFIITISEKALISLFRISRLYDRIMDSSEAINRLYKLANQKLDIINPVNGLKVKDLKGEVKFNNVNFIYEGSHTKALDKVNLKINSGCTTALVGPSGGGKTTVVRLIYRHYDPQSGTVFLDGKNLKDYDLYEFRKFIAIVPQEVEVFNTSVRDNISYANPRVGLAEIKAAAKIANADEFIGQLAGKYETLVGERGIKLSGGQKQRIGIARAVLANPRILIFDEATSNLDSKSEKLIQEAMEKIKRDRTVIIIAHRLSTIKKADKIIVLEDGKVSEEGSHFELANRKGGLYAELLKLQRMGEVD
ncbi:MAG: ABC transporter ATP-binding protein [Patescibacteria group bacterium]|nr:ABC transporter ATP-binding protein [Patescibacteria group bacterium]MDD5554202.1 ABC transporter ATP-binding protein [Patescibacteria group bacterium]